MAQQPEDSAWVSYTNAHHYALDGVPMKIADIFKPAPAPKKLSGNMWLDRSQSKVLNNDYNYETESGYMRWYQEYTEDKKKCAEALQDKKAKEEQAAHDEAEKAKQKETSKGQEVRSKSSTHPAQPKPKSPQKVSPPTLPKSVVASSVILTPQPAAAPAAPKTPQSSANNYVNVTDFENLGEDPFDNLELKSMNDMEELKNVLSQSQAPPKEDPVIVSAEDTADIADSVTEPNISEDKRNQTGDYENVFIPSANNPFLGDANIYKGVSGSTTTLVGTQSERTAKEKPERPPPPSVLNPLSRVPVPSPRNSVSTEPEKPIITSSATDSLPSDSLKRASRKPAVKSKPAVAIKPKTGKTFVKPFKSPTTTVPSGGSKIMSLQNLLAKEQQGEQKLKGAQGFSYMKGDNKADIPSGLSKENISNIEWPSLGCPTTSTSNAATAKDVPPTTTASSMLKPVAAEYHRHTNGTSAETPIKPVNTDELPIHEDHYKDKDTNSNGKRSEVTDNLLAMGFDRVQINAAMRVYNCDMREILDHLCAIETVTADAGVKWQTAQQALFIFKGDHKKAVQYSQAFEKLSEFGFTTEKVKSALLENDLEQSKALESLL